MQGDNPEPLVGQQSVDYTNLGFSGVGEIAYSAVWACRGVIITGSMTAWITAGYEVGDIIWFQPERLTSGVRDANQLFAGGAGSAGFALTWQEDPMGLRPGKAEGPGHGWGGAVTSNGTDIWYSYLTWANMLKTDAIPSKGSGEFPLAKVKMSLPTRISNNDLGYNSNDDDTNETAATRPNCFLQTYTVNPEADPCDQVKNAYAIIAYAESRTNPLGRMEPKSPGSPDAGKNAMYHSFEFTKPIEDAEDSDANIRSGNIANLQRTDADGNLLWLTDFSDNEILDANGDPLALYYNCRRPRFVMQSKSAAGNSGTVLLLLYKAGIGGAGSSSDIMMRRCVANGFGNPYKFENFLPGAQNLSTVTVSKEGFAGLRSLEWQQTVDNLDDKPDENTFEDARAHRGAIRGDFVAMGYTWTPNIEMSLRGYDTYNFYIRKSYDGGQTWTTDPDGTTPVEHVEKFFHEFSLDTYETTSSYGPNVFEPARNVSLLPIDENIVKNEELTTVIEPRLVAVPGPITKTNPHTCGKESTGNAEDKQNRNVFYMTWATKYFFSGVEGDINYNFSMDKGKTLVKWPFEPLTDVVGDYAEAEAQIRMTPDGSKFYAIWLEEGLEEGNETSDIIFRRILPSEFDRSSLRLELGEIPVNHEPTRIEFDTAFTEPVIIANAVTRNGSEPFTIGITNVTSSGFDINIREYNYLDGIHTQEIVSYMVMDKGSYLQEDGSIVEAGLFEASGDASEIFFENQFSVPPVVFASTVSSNGVQTVAGRTWDVNSSSFMHKLQRQESNKDLHGIETVAYLAMTPGVMSADGMKIEVGRTPDKVTHQSYKIQLSHNFTELPFHFAGMQTKHGNGTCLAKL